MANLEGVSPAVYWKFKDDKWPPGIPLQEAARLMQAYYRTLKANTRRFEELNHILTIFNEAAIPVILIKGAHLAWSIYPDIGLRPMSDLDLLVRHQNLEEALLLVNRMGYAEYLPELMPGMNQEIGHHYHLKDEQGTCLELHWSLVAGGNDWRTPPAGWAWSQSEKIVSWHETGVQPLALNLLANLLYLSAHISLQHGIAPASLGWFFDIHLLIQRAGAQLDWTDLSNKSQELGWSFALGATLSKVQECFNTIIPEAVLNTLQQEGSQNASLVIRKSTQSTPLDRALNALAPYGAAMKAKMIFAHLFPTAALIRYQYRPQPAWLWPLYYLYHLWKISRKILSGLYHRLIASPPP